MPEVLSIVDRYLAALRAQDWDALAATLEPDVERTGPYNDVYRSREPYVAYLADVFATRRDRTLFVRGGGDVRYGEVVAAMDVAKGAGAARIGIMTAR